MWIDKCWHHAVFSGMERCVLSKLRSRMFSVWVATFEFAGGDLSNNNCYMHSIRLCFICFSKGILPQVPLYNTVIFLCNTDNRQINTNRLCGVHHQRWIWRIEMLRLTFAMISAVNIRDKFVVWSVNFGRFQNEIKYNFHQIKSLVKWFYTEKWQRFVAKTKMSKINDETFSIL